MSTKIILKCALAFFFLFFLHGTSIGNGQQGISYNDSGLCVVALSRNLKLTTTHSWLLRKAIVMCRFYYQDEKVSNNLCRPCVELLQRQHSETRLYDRKRNEATTIPSNEFQ